MRSQLSARSSKTIPGMPLDFQGFLRVNGLIDTLQSLRSILRETIERNPGIESDNSSQSRVLGSETEPESDYGNVENVNRAIVVQIFRPHTLSEFRGDHGYV